MAALGPIELLFLLGPLALVPLALPLLGESRPLAWARRLLWPGALAAAASFLTRRGWASGLLAGGWWIVLLLLALHGLALLVDRGFPGRTALAAACLLVPVGGGWLVVSRVGLEPFGFLEPVPLLTAVHFHFAVFGSLVLIGRAGEWLEGRLYDAVVAAAVAGPLLVATGIASTPVLEAVGGVALAWAVGTFAILILFRVVPRVPIVAAVLLTISSTAILMGMACALAWLVGRVTPVALISMGQMARVHGPLNALGFCLCGLIGWNLLPRNLSGHSR